MSFTTCCFHFVLVVVGNCIYLTVKSNSDYVYFVILHDKGKKKDSNIQIIFSLIEMNVRSLK